MSSKYGFESPEEAKKSAVTVITDIVSDYAQTLGLQASGPTTKEDSDGSYLIWQVDIVKVSYQWRSKRLFFAFIEVQLDTHSPTVYDRYQIRKLVKILNERTGIRTEMDTY